MRGWLWAEDGSQMGPIIPAVPLDLGDVPVPVSLTRPSRPRYSSAVAVVMPLIRSALAVTDAIRRRATIELSRRPAGWGGGGAFGTEQVWP